MKMVASVESMLDHEVSARILLELKVRQVIHVGLSETVKAKVLKVSQDIPGPIINARLCASNCKASAKPVNAVDPKVPKKRVLEHQESERKAKIG